jgi:hypothetical protein
VTVLVCMLLYHTACPPERLPATTNVVDGLEYAMAAAPPVPPWWPTGVLV